LKRLNKLAESTSPNADSAATITTASPTPSSQSQKNVTIFLIVQPFTVSVSSEVFGSHPLRQFLTLLYKQPQTSAVQPADVSSNVFTAISQSVRADTPSVVAGGAEALVRWNEDQVTRVVESAVTDVLEEFALKSQLKGEL
jgi:hypothetical protein